jgi:hypothetical protein
MTTDNASPAPGRVSEPVSFTITIQRRLGSGWPIVAQWAPPGNHVVQRREGMLELDPADLVASPDARSYGAFLGQRVFVDSVRSGFESAVASTSDPLHVLLVLEDPEIQDWRWERISGPLDGGWRPLALTTKAPLVIHEPSLVDVNLPPLGRDDLRALVVVANPRGLERYRLASFDADAAASGIGRALAGVPTELLAPTAGSIGPPTLDAISQRLTASAPSILHVVCHGWRRPDTGETVLYLADAGGEVDPVPATELLDRVGGATASNSRPRLVFLASCETAAPSAPDSLASLARRLVRELGVPAVVAMTERVGVATALELSGAFYDRLRAHGQADVALSEASAGMAGRQDILVPALYSLLGGQSVFTQVSRSAGEDAIRPGPTFETNVTGGEVGKIVNVGNIEGTVTF